MSYLWELAERLLTWREDKLEYFDSFYGWTKTMRWWISLNCWPSRCGKIVYRYVYSILVYFINLQAIVLWNKRNQVWIRWMALWVVTLCMSLYGCMGAVKFEWGDSAQSVNWWHNFRSHSLWVRHLKRFAVSHIDGAVKQSGIFKWIKIIAQAILEGQYIVFYYSFISYFFFYI